MAVRSEHTQMSTKLSIRLFRMFVDLTATLRIKREQEMENEKQKTRSDLQKVDQPQHNTIRYNTEILLKTYFA
jgi:hypothetical protein